MRYYWLFIAFTVTFIICLFTRSKVLCRQFADTINENLKIQIMFSVNKLKRNRVIVWRIESGFEVVELILLIGSHWSLISMYIFNEYWFFVSLSIRYIHVKLYNRMNLNQISREFHYIFEKYLFINVGKWGYVNPSGISL